MMDSFDFSPRINQICQKIEDGEKLSKNELIVKIENPLKVEMELLWRGMIRKEIDKRRRNK